MLTGFISGHHWRLGQGRRHPYQERQSSLVCFVVELAPNLGCMKGFKQGNLHSTLWWRAASYLSTYESFRPVCYLSPCTSSGKSRTLADVSSGVYRSGSVGDVSSGVYRSGSLNSATVVLGINPRHWAVKNPAWLHTPGTYPQDIPWIHKGFPGRSIPL